MMKKSFPWPLVVLTAGLCLSCEFVAAQNSSPANFNYAFPADAGIVDVSRAPYFVTPDLSPDETTRRINAAIKDNIGGVRGKTIYLPDGVYRVNDTIAFMTWDKANPEYQFPYLSLLGQSRDKTIIRLVDNAPGFGDATQPKAIVSTLEVVPGAKDVWTFVHFGVYVQNLTVDTGKGNRGALGVEFMVNNQGAMRDVSIRGEGLAGLDMRVRSQPGPGLVKNVSIEGFDYGVDVGTWAYCMTFEHLTLRNQRIAGIRNHQNSLFIRDLKSFNRVPAIQNTDKDSYLVLAGAQLGGGSREANAIENSGFLVARDVKARGYGATLRDGRKTVRGALKDTVSNDLVFGPNGRLTKGAGRLGLPVRETPSAPRALLSDWVNVRDFGAKPEAEIDNSVAVQKAVDSLSDPNHPNFGKSTIYFPNDSKSAYGHHYFLARPIRLHGNVRRVVGFGSALGVMGEWKKQRGATFVVENLRAPMLWIEGFIPNWGPNWDQNYTQFVEHRSPCTLVLRDIGVASYLYRAAPGAGDVFLENVASGQWSQIPDEPAAIFWRGQKVWARQFNPETHAPPAPAPLASALPSTQVLNDGAKLWILGFKTEGGQTQIHNRSGQLEVLGSYFWAAGKAKTPIFLNENGRLWASMTQTFGRDDLQFGPVLQENPGAKILSMNALPQRTGWAAGTWAPVLRSGF